MLVGPVADLESAAERDGEFAHDARRGIQIREIAGVLRSRRRPCAAAAASCIETTSACADRTRTCRQKIPAHLEGAHARYHAERRDIALSHDQHHPIADSAPSSSANASPRITPIAARLQVAPSGCPSRCRRSRPAIRCRRNDAAATADAVSLRVISIACSSMYGAAHVRILCRLAVASGASRGCGPRAPNGGVRGQAQDPGAQLVLEAVHHGQHDDQYGHAQRHARSGDAGDEGHEAGRGMRERTQG